MNACSLSHCGALDRIARSLPGSLFTYSRNPDGTGSFPYASPGIAQLLGLAPGVSAVQGVRLMSLVHPDDHDRVSEIFETALREETPFHAECRVEHAARGETWIEIHAMPERDSSGRLMWHGFILDISSRKNVEQALAARERELRTLVDSYPDPVIRYDREGRRIFFNSAFARLAGPPAPDFIGITPDASPILGRYAQSYAEKLREVLSTGEPAHFEVEALNAEGEARWYHVRFIPETGAHGPVGSVLAISNDISGFKEAVRLQHVREREFRTLVENSPDSMVRFNRECRRVYLNQADEDMTGINMLDHLGTTPEELSVLEPAAASAYQKDIEQVLSSGLPRETVLDWLGKDGQRRWLHVRIVPEQGLDGQVESALCIGRDITPLKQVELTQFKLEREFRMLVENAPDPMIRFDREGRRLYVNKAQLKLTGLALDRQLGKTPVELSNLGHAAAPYLARILEAAASGLESRHVFEWDSPEGIHYWHDVSFVPEHGFDGLVESVLVVVRDITALKQAEQDVRAREREFRTVVENSPDSIVRFDRDFRRVFANSGFASIYGADPKDVLGKTPFEVSVLPPGEALRFQRVLAQVMRTNAPACIMTQRTDENGETRWLDMSLVPESGPDGQAATVLAITRDVTSIKRAERLQYEREREFRSLVENSPDPIIRFDRECRRVYANPAFLTLSGFQEDELLGNTPLDGRILGESSSMYMERLRHVLATGEASQIMLVVRTADGELRNYQARLVPEAGPDGDVESLLVVARDVTDIRKATWRAEEVETVADVGYFEYDGGSGRIELSRGACRILECREGWEPCLDDLLSLAPPYQRDAIRKSFKDAFLEKLDRVVLETSVESAEGVRHVRCHARMEYRKDGSSLWVAGMVQDISSVKAYQRRLHDLAFRDELTGLPNRTLFMDRFRQAAEDSVREKRRLGFMLLDLDDFKTVNDTCGHMLGDLLLRQVAHRLKDTLRQDDTVARLGGDEFAVILPDVPDAASLGTVAEKIVNVFSTPFALDDRELFISCSIGIVVLPTDGLDTGELLRCADSAMYHAKATGKNSYRFYSKELSERTRERGLISEALRQALPNGEFSLHFQPQFDLLEGRLTGAEALLRWNHPELGQVPPGRFIPIAEETGLIVDIGRWVLHEACAAANRWNNGKNGPRVALNLSPRQFLDGDIVKDLRSALDAAGCDPGRVELEITESMLLENRIEVRTTLESLKDVGVSLAIDDFGTGFSALSYLTSFPVDTIKIDRSFIQEIATNPSRAELVKAIVSMGFSLGCDLVAEGVETVEQEQFLKASGCRFVQGYLYGKPMPEMEFMRLLPHQRQ